MLKHEPQIEQNVIYSYKYRTTCTSWKISLNRKIKLSSYTFFYYYVVARHFAQHESVMQNNVPDIVNLVLEKALKRARYASNMGQKEHK